MEGILSTTFGKHNNFWSGNRLIITNSTDTAMNLYKVPDCHRAIGFIALMKAWGLNGTLDAQ